VNELLEDLVSPLPPPDAKQTRLSAAELRAAPDPANANPGAYTALKAASYPHTLPYDAALDQLRTVLAQSNVALWQLRQALRPMHGATPPTQAAAIASERFGIGLNERTLITTPNAVALSVAWNTPTPVTDLAPVNAFLLAASLTYEQLLELLEVVWVRGGGAASTIAGVDDTCDTTTQTIAPLDANRLDLMHRFLRLWRHAGWKFWELDSAPGACHWRPGADAGHAGQSVLVPAASGRHAAFSESAAGFLSGHGYRQPPRPRRNRNDAALRFAL
jgi:hypothetical protein